MLTGYTSTKSGNQLERKLGMFFWRGRYFTGLVDVAANALYDDPEDSFADHVGMPGSLEQGLITASNAQSHRTSRASGEGPVD